MIIGRLHANGVIRVDSDKSITHRALLLGAFSSGVTKIINPSFCNDCYSTINCIKVLGARVDIQEKSIEVRGGIRSGSYVLDAQNSGTTARLLMGLIAGRTGVTAIITGDSSLKKRPMKRIVDPLLSMGADIEYLQSPNCLPIRIVGKKLKGIDYHLPFYSAQLKSAILLAGLWADGQTSLYGKLDTRDHTEIMLRAMGARLDVSSECIKLRSAEIKGTTVEVAGDFSSAIFFLVLAILTKNGEITVQNVNINPTRTASLKLLEDIGAKIMISNRRENIESSADITAFYSKKLSPFRITADNAYKMIDELPLFAVLACFIEGESIIEGADELRLKESDRIAAIADGLTRMGANVQVTADGLRILGSGKLKGGCSVQSYGDHRIEMSLAVASSLCDEACEVESGNAQIRFPSFYKILDELA